MALLTHWDGEPVQVWADLWKSPLVEAHDALGSTNDRARELAQAGAEPYTVVLAEEQTAGRGRTGGSWHSPAGSGLWISTLVPVEERLPTHLPLVVGLAAAAAMEEVCAGVRVGLKWPNDVEIHGRKAGGILCERAHGPVVVGIGLNVSQKPGDFPRELADRAVSLETAGGCRVSVGALATALLRQLRGRLPVADGPLAADAHGELAARDVLRDRRVETQQAGEGIARGIDLLGALVIEQEDGRHVRVVAGSVRIR